MTIYTPPFKSDIFYSVQNEDYQTELAILHRINRDDLRVLMVASSGENALSLLTHPKVAAVDAIDINPAQLHLCELRRVALEYLTRDEQLRLLGADFQRPLDEGSEERQAFYDRLRPHLPDDARAFWDERRDHDIAFGLHHVGRNDVGMQDVRTQIENAGFAPFDHPLEESDLPKWKALYEALMTPEYIQGLFGLPSQALANRIAEISSYLGENHFHALRQADAESNPFVTTVFLGRYPADEAGLPLYLQESGQDSLRQLGTSHRLRLYQGNMLEWMPRLAADDEPFDLISISNIADWMSEAEFSAVAALARDCLKPGGALLARTATPRHMIETVMSDHLQVDKDFNAELRTVERGPWFRIISAGFKM